MLVLLSPAKGQNFEPTETEVHVSEPRLLSKSNELIDILRLYSPDELMTLMNVSEKIGNLTAERFASFSTPFNESNAKPAAFAFSGDVYKGLAFDSLNGVLNEAKRSAVKFPIFSLTFINVISSSGLYKRSISINSLLFESNRGSDT
jgi:hypothetical protein